MLALKLLMYLTETEVACGDPQFYRRAAASDTCIVERHQAKRLVEIERCAVAHTPRPDSRSKLDANMPKNEAVDDEE